MGGRLRENILMGMDATSGQKSTVEKLQKVSWQKWSGNMALGKTPWVDMKDTHYQDTKNIRVPKELGEGDTIQCSEGEDYTFGETMWEEWRQRDVEANQLPLDPIHALRTIGVADRLVGTITGARQRQRAWANIQDQLRETWKKEHEGDESMRPADVLRLDHWIEADTENTMHKINATTTTKREPTAPWPDGPWCLGLAL